MTMTAHRQSRRQRAVAKREEFFARLKDAARQGYFREGMACAVDGAKELCKRQIDASPQEAELWRSAWREFLKLDLEEFTVE